MRPGRPTGRPRRASGRRSTGSRKTPSSTAAPRAATTGSGLRRLIEISERPVRRIVGLMSGTSVDGIDAAICDIRGHGSETEIKLVHFMTVPFAEDLQTRIHESFEGDSELLCETNFVLGEAFADAALRVIEEAGLKPADVDAIASPGQTIYHIDPTSGGVPSTLQLGESCVVAERTGSLVVSDFRTRDIAAGGSGAPLIPCVDTLLFSQESGSVALQNIGGIANVTILPPRGHEQELVAFDTGPGNMIIDEIVKELHDDDAAYDADGRYSALGRVDDELLAKLMENPYFDVSPPKSTGREMFGIEFCQDLVESYDGSRILDLLATVVAFTAHSIHDQLRRFVLPRTRIESLIVSGGGMHNKTLMRHLKRLCKPDRIEVLRWDDWPAATFSGDAREAVAFAVLANETLLGHASGLPAATGARHAVIQGKITL